MFEALRWWCTRCLSFLFQKCLGLRRCYPQPLVIQKTNDIDDSSLGENSVGIFSPPRAHTLEQVAEFDVQLIGYRLKRFDRGAGPPAFQIRDRPRGFLRQISQLGLGQAPESPKTPDPLAQ